MAVDGRDVEESWGRKLAQRSFETFLKSSSSWREGAPEVRRFGTTRDLDRNKKVFHPFLRITRQPKGRGKGSFLKISRRQAEEIFPTKCDLPAGVEDVAVNFFTHPLQHPEYFNLRERLIPSPGQSK